MKKFLFCFLLIISFVSISLAQTRAKFIGTVSKGGKIVRTSPSVQYKLMETYPASTVTVKIAGTSTLATLYSDEIGTPKSNPFTSNSIDASFEFYVDVGRFDITFSGTGILSPFTWSDVFIQVGGGGGGSGVDTFEGRNGSVISQVGDYTWNEIDKTISSLADITTRSASDLSSGTLQDARFPSTLPAISGINLTDLNANNIETGTLDDARLSTNIPKKDAINTFTQDNYFTSNVGINTTTPRRRLDVLDPSNAQMRLSAVDNSVYTDFFVDSGGSLTVIPTGNVIFNATGKRVNPLNNFDQSLGQINKKYLSLHAAELFVETLVAQNTIATIGGRIIIAPSNMLIADLSPVSTTISVKYNNLANGDRIYMEGNLSVEFMAVTSGATVISGGFSYAVTRNLDGTGANQWFAGDAIVNTGVAGNGFIDLYSVRGVKSSTQIGPAIVGNIRNSSTYNDWTEHWAIGSLDGVYGHTAGVFGAAFGRYANGFNHIDIDDVNGFRIIKDLSTVVGRWAIDGTIFIGETAAGKENIVIGSSALVIRNNTTERIRLNSDSSGFLANNLISWDTSGNLTIQDATLKIAGASSFFSIGTTPPTSSSSGTGIFIDRTGLYGLNAGVVQSKIDATTGALVAAGGILSVDANGLTFSLDDTASSFLTWKDTSGNLLAQTVISDSASNGLFGLKVFGPDSALDNAQFNLDVQSGISGAVNLVIRASNTGSYISVGGVTNFRGVVIDIDSGGTPSPTLNAALEIRSTTGAFIPPKMSTTARDALIATNGMVIYNITIDKLQVRAAGVWTDLH